MGFINRIESLNEVPQFNVEKVPLFDANHRPIDAYSLQRTDTNQHLGVVGERYRPIQMEEMVDVLNRASNIVDSGIQHVGYTMSRGGRKVLIQSKLSETINVDGDEVDPYFYTMIDNTGMGSNKTIPSTLRIACDNALHMLTISSDTCSRHSSIFDTRVETMVGNIAQSIQAAKNFNDTMKKLKGIKYTRDEMVKLTQRLIPVEKEESTKRALKRERIVELFESGRGNVGETRWDALNAITEYETHTGKQSPEKLMRNLLNATMSRKGLQLLTAA